MHSKDLNVLTDGSITSPKGFVAGATYAGIKTYGDEPRLDVAALFSEAPCSAAGVFTQNRVVGAPVTVSRTHLESGLCHGIIANSGCSNVATGSEGIDDARRMAALAGNKLGVTARDILVASTGVIGRRLPMEKIEVGIEKLSLSPSGGHDFARAIMTTDTVAKSRAVQCSIGGIPITIGGTAKGSGMVHPDMATVFCFLTTDACIPTKALQPMLKRVADVSINMVDVDMDTSTSDCMFILANGQAGGTEIDIDSAAAGQLEEAMRGVAIELAKDLARDGEGAKTMIEVVVEGAASQEDARSGARTIVSSPLVKTMVTGKDANLGRVLMALGRSGMSIDINKTSVFIGEGCAFRNGVAADMSYEEQSRAMEGETVRIRVDLGLGTGAATAWGCDLTEGYVRINADYTT